MRPEDTIAVLGFGLVLGEFASFSADVIAMIALFATSMLLSALAECPSSSPDNIFVSSMCERASQGCLMLALFFGTHYNGMGARLLMVSFRIF